MVGGPERTAPVERQDRSLPCRGSDGRGGQGITSFEWRQQAGGGPRQQGLAGSGRAYEEERVATSQGNLEGPPGYGLTTDLGQIRDLGWFERGRSLGRRGLTGRARRAGTDQVDAPRIHALAGGPSGPDCSQRGGQVRRRVDLDPIDEPGFRHGFQGHDDTGNTTSGQRRDHRQDARHAAQLAAERQLADHGPAAGRPGLLRPEQDANGNRGIERGPRLA